MSAFKNVSIHSSNQNSTPVKRLGIGLSRHKSGTILSPKNTTTKLPIINHKTTESAKKTLHRTINKSNNPGLKRSKMGAKFVSPAKVVPTVKTEIPIKIDCTIETDTNRNNKENAINRVEMFDSIFKKASECEFTENFNLSENIFKKASESESTEKFNNNLSESIFKRASECEFTENFANNLSENIFKKASECESVKFPYFPTGNIFKNASESISPINLTDTTITQIECDQLSKLSNDTVSDNFDSDDEPLSKLGNDINYNNQCRDKQTSNHHFPSRMQYLKTDIDSSIQKHDNYPEKICKTAVEDEYASFVKVSQNNNSPIQKYRKPSDKIYKPTFEKRSTTKCKTSVKKSENAVTVVQKLDKLSDTVFHNVSKKETSKCLSSLKTSENTDSSTQNHRKPFEKICRVTLERISTPTCATPIKIYKNSATVIQKSNKVSDSICHNVSENESFSEYETPVKNSAFNVNNATLKRSDKIGKNASIKRATPEYETSARISKTTLTVIQKGDKNSDKITQNASEDEFVSKTITKTAKNMKSLKVTSANHLSNVKRKALSPFNNSLQIISKTTPTVVQNGDKSSDMISQNASEDEFLRQTPVKTIENMKSPQLTSTNHLNNVKRKTLSPFNNSLQRSKRAKVTNSAIQDKEQKLMELSEEDLKNRIALAEKELEKNKEDLNRLSTKPEIKKLVELQNLRHLKKIWLTGCQEALEELLQICKETEGDSMNMTTLLGYLKIPCEKVYFNKDDMVFAEVND